MEKITVIIPVYNAKDYIEDCVESILNQTYNNLEVLLIDDGSGEATKELLSKIEKSDNRIKLYSYDINRGVAFARNTGIKKANGKYIYFVDSDDYLPNETIELLSSHTNLEMNIGSVKRTYLSRSFSVTYSGHFAAKTYTDKKYTMLKRKSIINILFEKEFIDKNKLSFSNEYTFYSDLDFLVQALQCAKAVSYLKEAVYFKRLRDENISNPSLMNINKTKNIIEVYKIFRKYKLKLTSDEIEIEGYGLDDFILNYYRKNTINYIKKHGTIEEIYDDLLEAMKLLEKEKIKNLDLILRAELKALISENKKKYFRIMSKHTVLRKLKKANTNRKKLIFLYQNVFNKLPLDDNLVFLESFIGRNYSDNTKYIYEYLLENYPKLKFVWSFNDPSKDIPGNAIQVKRFSLEYFYYLSRAKYWVSNSRLPLYLTKKKGNIYLQTWHGTPLKTLVFDIDEIFSADAKYKEHFYEQSRRWDYLVSPNTYSTNIFRRAFKYDGEMLEFGYPRNDILYTKNNEQEILDLKIKMNIPLDKKTILYAPTWRDDDYMSRGNYNFSLQLDLKDVKDKLGEDYIILLRTHYHVTNQLDLSGFDDFVFDFSSYDDIAELYLVSDMLITDYSSVFFDYANLKRPILFYMYDIEKYRDDIRGLYIDVEKELPGPILKETSEVIESISNINQINIKYKSRYKDFYEKFCKWDDGTATEKTVIKVFGPNK